MDKKELDRKNKEYLREKQKYRDEMTMRDLAVHGEDSRLKYDPATGSLKEEKQNG